MILIRAPLRVSFVGGGTDLPEFYKKSPGRVLSMAIDKFVFLAIHPTPMIDKISARYSKSETVNTPEQLQHTRIRTALLALGIKNNLEIGSFASLPSRTGLGSSSSFSVALMKGLHTHLGKTLSAREAAEAAAKLEIELLGEPIGKQDQYAAAFGGWNVFQFNANGSVDVEPVLVDFRTEAKIEEHALLFYTGLTREASSVLSGQRAKIDEHLDVYKQMADSVYPFRDKVLAGDVEGMAAMLHEAWQRKKSLSPGVSTALIDSMYELGRENGAWGGKILGAGGGGCLLFLAPPEKHGKILRALENAAKGEGLGEARAIAFRSSQTGTDVLFNDQR